MRRLGLDHAALQAIHPGLITCSLSGYGAAGPLVQVAGHDANYLAAAGVMHRNGGRDGPMFYDPPLADISGALFGVIAILGALRARGADGRRCAIDIGLADTPMPLQLLEIAALGAHGEVPQRRESYLNGGAACYQVYATADGGHVAVGAIEAKFWAAFCRAAGRPEWIARQTEALPQTALIADVAACLARLTLAGCAVRFADGDCCTAPVLDLAEAVGSPHHRARGLVRATADGSLQALFPAHIDGAPPGPRPALRTAQS